MPETDPIDPERIARWTDTPQFTAEDADEDDPDYLAGVIDGVSGVPRARPQNAQYNLGYDNGKPS